MLLITGASGFFGANALFEALADGRNVAASYHEKPVNNQQVRAVEKDLVLPGAAEELLETFRPAWVLNCAALANVDRCESDPDLARQVNVDLPRYLAASCREAKVGLIHLSTDSVFDGQRGGYDEEEPAAPVNVYARTKLEGEKAVFDEMLDALVVRTNFVGYSPDARTGLAHWIIRELSAGKRISGFTDVVFNPLAANDLARVLFSMMDANLSGLYHLGGSTAVTKFDFARMFARELRLDETLVQPASVADARLGAPRPRNTTLLSARAEADLGRKMPSIEDTLALLGKLARSGYQTQLNALIGN